MSNYFTIWTDLEASAINVPGLVQSKLGHLCSKAKNNNVCQNGVSYRYETSCKLGCFCLSILKFSKDFAKVGILWQILDRVWFQQKLDLMG